MRHLLAFARPQTLQPRVVVVNTAVADAAALLRRLLGARVTLDLALEQPGRAILIDPGQLDQVLINLAVNGRDAMSEGGRLTLATGHATIYAPRPATTRRSRRAAMSPPRSAIPALASPEIPPRIFEPFFTTRRTQGSSGLGLSTVLGIVLQSSGCLEVDSTPGSFRRITLYLPRHRVDETLAPVAPAAPSSAVSRAGGGRIAPVAEDVALVRRTLTRALTRAGWQVLATETGEVALALVTPRRLAPSRNQ